MIAILIFILLVVLIAPLLFGRDKRTLFGINIYCTINAILIIPGAFALSSSPELLHPDIYFSVSPSQGALAWTILMIGLLNAAVYLGYFVVTRRAARQGISGGHGAAVRLQPYENPAAIVLLLGLTFTVFLQKLSLFGGLSAVTETVQNRVALQAGLGPLNFLSNTAAILAMIIAARRAIALRTPSAFAVLLAVALISAVMSSLFGGRKETIQLAAMVLATISIYSPPFLIFGLKTIAILIAAYASAFVYFIAILLYRTWTSGDLSMMNMIDQLSVSFEGYNQFLILLSYFDTYYFITNFFDGTTYYLGSTFSDLLTAFVPNGFMPDKPAVDDGVFVRAATLGHLLPPGTPAYLITHNAFPPETLGAAYMNGGPWLVGPFGLLLGAVFGKARQWIDRYPNSPFVIAIYLNIFLNFEISNLRITQLVTQAGLTFLLVGGLGLLFGRRRPVMSAAAVSA